MTAEPIVDPRDTATEHLREGWRVSDIEDATGLTRPKILDIAIAVGLTYNAARDTCEPSTPEAAHPAPVAIVKANAGRDALRARMESLSVTAKQLRAWAREHGIDTPATGMVGAALVDAYANWVADGRPAPEPQPEVIGWDGPPVEEWDVVAHDAPTEDVEAEAEHVRVVAIATSAHPALIAAVMSAATDTADLARVTVDGDWLYLEGLA